MLNTPTDGASAQKVQEAARLLLNLTSVDDVSAEHFSSVVNALTTLYDAGKLDTLVPALPLLLKLKGEPYSLHKHFVMEPLFSLRPPRSIVCKSARQISKSTSLAAQRSVYAALIPYFSSLYVAPRFEQTRRFSNNYVKPFLNESPLGHATLNPDAEQSVLQRSFQNGSLLHFSFAFLDADRVRGIAADSVSFDEVQDIDTEFIPIIAETLSASKYDWRQYTGTPKTMDNTLQLLWEESSQAEWVIQCPGCRHSNIATVAYDLLDMIQPQGPSCAKCGRLLDPSLGFYEHKYPERRFRFAGYHQSQIIMPMHYEPGIQSGTKDRWNELVIAKNKMDKAQFYNEKLGESCDVRVNLLTRTDLQNASVLPYGNNLKEALKHIDDYPERTMGVDWGGGGIKGISYTLVTIMGHAPDGTCDVMYMERFTNIADPVDEAQRILNYFRWFRCSILSHDFCGAGALRETLLLQAGLPATQVFPAAYVRATAAAMVTFKAATDDHPRWYYSVDKARSLVLLCQLIKTGLFRFPKFDTWEELSDDLLALVEDKHTMPSGPDIYLITSKANRSDDLAHAINYAAVCYWHAQGRYPQLAARLGIRLTAAQEAELAPSPADLRRAIR